MICASIADVLGFGEAEILAMDIRRLGFWCSAANQLQARRQAQSG